MMGVTVVGADKVRGNVARANMRLKTAQEVGVKRASILVSRALREELSEPAASDPFWGKVGAKGDGLSVRSGSTRARISPGGTVIRRGNTVMAAVGSPDEHMQRHESGGTFGGSSPRGFHRIPTAAAQTAAGVDRYKGQSIRDIAGAFLVKTLGGKLWAAVTNGSRSLTLLYLLVRSITLKPRRIFARTREKVRPQVSAALSLEVSSVVREANR